MAKFLIPHLNLIHAENPMLGTALQQVEDAINNLGFQTASSPVGSTNPPPDIASVTVQAANGLFEFEVVDHSPVLRGITYFIEAATNVNFSDAKVVYQGTSRNGFIQLGSQTYFFRAYSAYPTSARSRSAYFGSQANPTGVVGGGSAPPAPALAPQGSGTSNGANGGDGGYGNAPARGEMLELTL